MSLLLLLPKYEHHLKHGCYAMRADMIEDSVITQKLGRFRTRVEPNSIAVIYQRTTGDVKFVGIVIVESVRESSEGDARLQVITLSESLPFPEPRELSVLAGSLEKVKYFLAPERHFKRSVLKLSRKDFRSIVNLTIDIHRSVFRYLFSALPLELQADFIRQHIDSIPLSSNGTVIDYEPIAPLLVKYYQNHVRNSFELVDLVVKKFSEMDVEGFTHLNSLMLTDSNGENTIHFGRDSEIVSGLFSQNALFAKGEDRGTLVEEALMQIEGEGQIMAKTPPSVRRRWNDTLF